MTALLILAVVLLSPVDTAHAQYAQFVEDRGHPDIKSTADPCEDPSTPLALREALGLACSRESVLANRRVRRAIIVGFVGGFVRRNDVMHPEVLFATYLRSRYGAAVHAEVFGNHEEKKALEDVIRCLKPDGRDSRTATKEQVKLILYGHSWGASQTLSFARELQRRGIPVALTIQIDSIKKFGQDDRNVPANVAKAVNFYQRKGITRGQLLIVPADPSRTEILGNFQRAYENHPINCDNYRWLSRVFNKPHHEIENDPWIWNQIAILIDSELLTTNADVQAAPSRP